MTYLVPDTLVWYNKNQLPDHPYPGYVTNGPIYNLEDQVPTTWTGPIGTGNHGNWEPYLSVIGDSTFLIGCGLFADDGSWAGSPNFIGVMGNQRYVLTFQPAAGGPPKNGEAFYDDFGQPYALHQMMRQRNPAVRVAGDKRWGAQNFLAGGAAALMYAKLWFGIDYFNTDGRLNTAYPLYGTAFGSVVNNVGSGNPPGTADSQWVFLQTFSLNPTTLAQTPLSRALDPIYYPAWTNRAPPQLCAAAGLPGGGGATANNNVSYFGGEIAALDNGNYVVVADDYTGFFGGQAPGKPNAVAKIFAPDGTSVKDTWLVDPREIWSNVAAFRGGFAVRVQTLFYFYDNNGNPTATNSVRDSSLISFDIGRGDGARIASDIRSHFVYLATPVNLGGGSNVVMLGVWDGRNGAFVTNAIVPSDLDATVTTVDRVNLAVDALDRVCVAFTGKPDANVGFPNNQIIARVMKFDGTNVSYLTPSFFPFINADSTNNLVTNGMMGFKTINPSVAMTTEAICIAAKANVNSTNNPAGGPDAGIDTTVYTVISHPAPVAPPRPRMTITLSGNNVLIAWDADAGLFKLQQAPSMPPAVWSDVSPQPAIVPATDNKYSMTVPAGTGSRFFRLAR